jgi:L1 cell adhesion molecule like protein
MKLKEQAEEYLKCSVSNCVVTVPAYFNDSQLQATMDAGKIAGLNVMKCVKEPTAAAIAFGVEKLESLKNKKILVFDLGGGTFDVSIMDILGEGEFKVNGVTGDAHLGGEDFDNHLIKFCIDAFKEETEIDLSKNGKALRRLKTYCETAKK